MRHCSSSIFTKEFFQHWYLFYSVLPCKMKLLTVIVTLCHVWRSKGQVAIVGRCGDEVNATIRVRGYNTNMVQLLYEEANPTRRLDLEYRLTEIGNRSIKFNTFKTYDDISLAHNGQFMGESTSNTTQDQFTYKNRDFLFIGGFFFVGYSGQYAIAGLNQQWGNCPQPICVYSQLDAAFTDDGTPYIIRGKYVWNAAHVPTTANARLLSSIVPDIPSYVDSAFRIGNERYFTQGTSTFCKLVNNAPCTPANLGSNLGSLGTGPVSYTPNHAIDAAFAIPQTQKFVYFLYEGTERRMFRMTKIQNTATNRFNVTEGLDLLTVTSLYPGIDAAFTMGERIILFQRNNYFESYLSAFNSMTLNAWASTLQPQPAYKLLYSCPDEIYSAKPWVLNENMYRDQFKNLYESRKTRVELERILNLMKQGYTQTTRITSTPESNNIVPFIIVASIISAIIVIIAIVYGEKTRRVRKRYRKKLQERSRMESNILDSKYDPGRLSRAESQVGRYKTGAIPSAMTGRGEQAASGIQSTMRSSLHPSYYSKHSVIGRASRASRGASSVSSDHSGTSSWFSSTRSTASRASTFGPSQVGSSTLSGPSGLSSLEQSQISKASNITSGRSTTLGGSSKTTSRRVSMAPSATSALN